MTTEIELPLPSDHQLYECACDFDECATYRDILNFAKRLIRERDKQWANRISSAPAQGMVLVPRELVAFLDGESPIDGVWFGERHPDHKGLFWWRKALMQCAASPGAASVAGKEGEL